MTALDLLIVFNLFVLESLLSVDNAAVLAIMVKPLPENQRSKALKYGIGGALIFRGACLFLAGWLVKFLWLKIIGGCYLLYLTYKHFYPTEDSGTKKNVKINFLSPFWSTIVMVEVMDLAFSIDNVFAAVAMTSNIYLILIGVSIGIISMRFVAQWFVTLIDRFPSLERSAFIVISALGAKLIICGLLDYTTGFDEIKGALSSHLFDLFFSGLMILLFAIPILFTDRKPA